MKSSRSILENGRANMEPLSHKSRSPKLGPRACLVGLCLAGLVPFASRAFAQNESAGQNISHLDARIINQSLDTIITMLSDGLKKSIILGQGLESQRGTVYFEDLPADKALQAFAAAQALCIVEEDDFILLISRDEYMSNYAETEIVHLKHANPEGLAKVFENTHQSTRQTLLEVSFETRTRSLILRGDPRQIAPVREIAEGLDRSMTSKMFTIRYASAARIGESLRRTLDLGELSLGSVIVDERSNRLIIHESPENLALCEETILYLDIAVETRVFSTGMIDPQVIADQISEGELGAAGEEGQGAARPSQADVQVIQEANQIIVTDTPERLDNLEKVMRELNRNIGTRVIQPYNSTPEEIAAVVQSAFPNIVVTVDARSGSLIISGHREQLDRIEELVSQLDAEENIEIDVEAKIMLVSVEKVKEIGTRIFGRNLDGFNETLANISINPNFLADGKKTEGSLLGNPPGGPVVNPVKTSDNFLEIFQPNIEIEAAIRALESDGDTKVLSSPKLSMLVGRSASFFSGSSEPYKEVTLQDNIAVENVQFLQVGVTFEVTPFVSPDGIITLEVLTEFSSLREIRDGIPVVDTRRAFSTVEAEDGETIFLGGLISQENSDRRSGIPILRSIPGIGFLFGEKKTRDIERELVIVIRPTIKQKGVLSLVLSDAVSDDYGLVLDGFSEWKATPAKEE